MENETRSIDISNKTEVRKFATTMFVATRTYLNDLSGLLDYQLKLIKYLYIFSITYLNLHSYRCEFSHKI